MFVQKVLKANAYLSIISPCDTAIKLQYTCETKKYFSSACITGFIKT